MLRLSRVFPSLLFQQCPEDPLSGGVTHLHRRRVPEANLRDGAKIGRGESHLVLYPFMCECVGARGCRTAFSSQNCVVTFPAGGGGMVWQGERGKRRRKAGDEGARVTGAYLYHLVRVYLCTKRRTRPAVHVVMYIYVP